MTEWYFGARGMKPREDADNFYINGRVYPKWANGSQIWTREEAPYSYSAFVLRGDPKRHEGDAVSGCYSDRLRSWIDEDDWVQAWAQMPSKRFADLSLSDISRFLSRCMRKDVECLQVLEGCNVSNGYPYWYFTYQLPASAMSAGTAETAQQSLGNSPPARPEGIAQDTAPTRNPLIGDTK